MDAQSPPRSPAEARRMIVGHWELKAELDSQRDSISLARSTGQRLLADGHPSTPDILQALAGLDQELNTLERAWQGHQHRLQQALELQLVLSSMEQVESWLCSREDCPASEGLGDPSANVETLLWKHKVLERGLEAQAEKISALEVAAHSLQRGGHPEAQRALGQCQALLLRKEALIERAASRRRQLEELRQLQTFLQDSLEVATWLREKDSVALDEGWRNPALLQTQLWKQKSLQAELDASVHHQQRLQAEGQRLLQEGHPASETIRERLQELGELWDRLQANSRRKAATLQEACEALRLRRSVEELESWLEPVEVTLRAPIPGRDQPGLDELLGAQGGLEAAVDRQAGQVQLLLGQAQVLTREGHCLAPDLEDRAQKLLRRFESLQEPLRERREALEARSRLSQFFRDAEEEMAWVQERLPLAATQDCGQSLSAVRHLQEKHQNLESEISSHEALTQAVVDAGHKLVRAGHSACDVAVRVQQLENAMGSLRAQVTQRRLLLQQAQEAQQFLTELQEAESWLEEQGRVLDIEDVGQSAEATRAFLRQLEATTRDLEGFSMRIERLQQTAALLESRQNPESPRVLARMRAAREAHSGLLQRAEGRRQGLQEQLQLHQLEREALLLDAWLASKVATAESQDHGQDLEAAKVLEEKFDAFRKEVQSLGQAKVQALRELAGSLERTARRHKPQIQAQRSRIEATWERLDRAMKARTQSLATACEVLGFEQEVAQLQGWMQEKVTLMARDICGHSLSSVQTLQQQHRCLERELAAMEKEVARMRMEACRLGQLHPVVRGGLSEQLAKMEDAWAALDVKAQEQGQQLEQAARGHAFLGRCRELLAWAQEKQVLASSQELAGDLVGAEQLLVQQEELGQEIKEYCLRAQDVRQEGQQLVDSGHFMSPEVTGCLRELEGQLQALAEACALRQERCEENWGLQKLRQELDQAEAWLASREGLLLDPNCGHSVADVELLLHGHHDLEKSLAAQQEKFAQLQRETGDAKGAPTMEGFLELKQQWPAERQPSSSPWDCCCGTLGGSSLSLFWDKKTAAEVLGSGIQARQKTERPMEKSGHGHRDPSRLSSQNVAPMDTLDLTGAQCERLRLSSGVEILYAAPSEQHAWSWHRALSGTAVLEAGKSNSKAPADCMSAHCLSLEHRARPLGFTVEPTAERAPKTAASLSFQDWPLTTSVREPHVSADGQLQPMELLQAAGLAQEPAQGSHRLSCPGQAQGLGPEANPEMAPNLEATNKDSLY